MTRGAPSCNMMLLLDGVLHLVQYGGGGGPYRVPRNRRLVVKVCQNSSPTKIIFSRYIFSRSNPIDSIQSINQFPVDIQRPPQEVFGWCWGSSRTSSVSVWLDVDRVHSKDDVFCFSSFSSCQEFPTWSLEVSQLNRFTRWGPYRLKCISGMVAHGTQLRGTSRTSSAFRSVGETEIFWYVIPQCMGIFTYIFAGYQTSSFLVSNFDRDFPCNTVDGRNPANYLCIIPCKRWDQLPTSR